MEPTGLRRKRRFRLHLTDDCREDGIVWRQEKRRRNGACRVSGLDFRDIRSDFYTRVGYRMNAGRHGLRSNGDKTAQGACELHGDQSPGSPPGKVELDRFRWSTTPAFLSPPQSSCRCVVWLHEDNLQLQLQLQRLAGDSRRLSAFLVGSPWPSHGSCWPNSANKLITGSRL